MERLVGYTERSPVGVREIYVSGDVLWLGGPVSLDRIDADLPIYEDIPSTEDLDT